MEKKFGSNEPKYLGHYAYDNEYVVTACVYTIGLMMSG